MHIKGMDGLRGIAAIAVFFTHFDQIIFVDLSIGYFDLGQLFENGKYAVSLFFTLSGFLLSMPFWQHRLNSAPRPAMTRYLWHRMARIIPAYYLCLTVLLLINGDWHLILTHPDALMHYLFIFNYAEFSIFSINSVFWTLAVEIQFYLLLPLLFRYCYKTSKKTIGITLFLILTATGIHYGLLKLVSQSIEWPWNHNLLWIRTNGAVLTHSILAHLPHFLFGIIAARYFLSSKKLTTATSWNTWLFILSSILLLTLLSTPLNDSIAFVQLRYGFPLLPFLITLIIISTPRSTLALWILDNKALKKLGKMSYGIYLYHLPVLNYLYTTAENLDHQPTDHAVLYGVTSFVVTLAIAYISYSALERPILKKVRHIMP